MSQVVVTGSFRFDPLSTQNKWLQMVCYPIFPVIQSRLVLVRSIFLFVIHFNMNNTIKKHWYFDIYGGFVDGLLFFYQHWNNKSNLSDQPQCPSQKFRLWPRKCDLAAAWCNGAPENSHSKCSQNCMANQLKTGLVNSGPVVVTADRDGPVASGGFRWSG